MSVTGKKLALGFAALVAVFFAPSAYSQSFTFQDQNYELSVILPGAGIPSFGGNDMFIIRGATTSYIVIASDAFRRGDYVETTSGGIFTILNKTNGNVELYTSINATLMNLDGSFFNRTSDVFVPNGVIPKPATIPEQIFDFAIIGNVAAYRTDGPQLTDEKVYYGTMSQPPIIQFQPAGQFDVSLKNADNPFLAFDNPHATILLFQRDLPAADNTDVRDRITSYNLDGTTNGSILLTEISTYSGGGGGLTVDAVTGTIYFLDTNQIFVFTPKQPQALAIAPASGSVQGGTTVVITGKFFPNDATVFFDGIAATNVQVVNSTRINAVAPAHAAGAVNVTIKGSGIPAGTPLTLPFTYVNLAPIAALEASPSQGSVPLTVTFTIANTSDPEGDTFTSLIDFGDGTTHAFLPGETTVTHTYTTDGSFTATLTVTDAGGKKGFDTETILVGNIEGELVLRTLTLKLNGGNRDVIQLQGELILPDEVDFSNGSVTVAIAHGEQRATDETTLDSRGRTNKGEPKFTMRLLKRKGFEEGTLSIKYSSKTADLTPLASLGEVAGRTTLTVELQLRTGLDRNNQQATFTFTKQSALVTITPKSSTIKFVRR